MLRGFRTARSFARALAIDENRYTRYERAEVEPSLDLIHRICQLLDIGPNELLGGAAGFPAAGAVGNGGMAERPAPGYGAQRLESADPSARAQQADALRWLIAREIVSLSGSGGNADELQQISRTFARLDRPFAGIAEILAVSEGAHDGSGGDTARLRQLVAQLAELWIDDTDTSAVRAR